MKYKYLIPSFLVFFGLAIGSFAQEDLSSYSTGKLKKMGTTKHTAKKKKITKQYFNWQNAIVTHAIMLQQNCGMTRRTRQIPKKM